MGLGAGALWDGIASMGGPHRSKDEAVRTTAEAVKIMRALWAPGTDDQKVSLAGQFYSLRDTHAGPLPAHRIDIWIGAYGPRMLRLIGRLADGWPPSTSYMGPDKLPAAQQIIDEAAHKAGREPTAIRRGYNVSGFISTADSAFTDKARPNAVVGSSSHWVDTLLHYYRDLRMDTFIYWPLAGELHAQARLFAEEVAPAVRAALGPPAQADQRIRRGGGLG